MNRNERISCLKGMLRQVAEGGDPETLVREQSSRLESGLESIGPSSADEDQEAAHRAVQKIARDDDLSDSEVHALEAIVMPRERPVIFIRDNSYGSLPEPWSHFSFSDVRSNLEASIPSIGRIELPDNLMIPYGGTGFVVGDNLLMTNRHVAELFAAGLGTKSLTFRPGQTAELDFMREVDSNESIKVRVHKVVMIHPYWDMALLQVDGFPTGHAVLTLSVSPPEELNGREIGVIGYPARDDRNDLQLQDQIFERKYNVKRLHPGRLRSRETIGSFGNQVSAMTHDSSTLGGNSGSAVIDVSSGQVVGLHFAGIYLKANYCVPTFDLARDSRVVDAGVRFGGTVNTQNEWLATWRLADLAESAPQTPVTINRSEPLDPPIAQPTRPDIVPMSPRASDIHTSVPATQIITSATGAGSWTLPLQVSVSIGTPVLNQGPAGPIQISTAGEGLFGSVSASTAVVEFSLQSLTATSFNWRTALSMALASQLAYSSSDDVRNTVLSGWGLQSCEFVDIADTQCFLAMSHDVAIVAFRGTESIGDWVADLNAIGITTSYGTVHRGFYHAFQDVKEALRQALLQRGSRPVLITGHSLGGALAMIAAAEWRRLFPVRFVYTFGQPRVVRSDFQSTMNEDFKNSYFRFVNDDDIVTRIPPGYRHIGRLFHFDPGGSLKEATESVGFASASLEQPPLTETQFDQLRAQLLAARSQNRAAGDTESFGSSPQLEGIFPSFRDHHLDGYIAKIRRFVN